MKFDENLAAIHGYLCGDGYISSQDKEISIRFGNTCLRLVKDFKKRTEKIFSIKRKITLKKVKNRKDYYCYCATKKQIYKELILYGPYYTANWRLPIKFLNKKGLAVWLRAFFDSEGWLQFKSHQTRTIAAHSLNHGGLLQIQKALSDVFRICSIVKKEKNRRISYLSINGKDDITQFQKEINFLHPEKRKKLRTIVNSYVSYEWNFPNDKEELTKFVKNIIRKRATTKLCKGKPLYIRLYSIIEENLLKLSQILHDLYGIKSKVYCSVNGNGLVYYEFSVQDVDSVRKMLEHELLNAPVKRVLSLQNAYRLNTNDF